MTDAIEPWNHGIPHCRLCGKNHWAREGCFPEVIKAKMEKKQARVDGVPGKPAASKSLAKPVKKRAKKKGKKHA